MTRKIAVLTGKRGGFGAMKPMLRAIDRDPELELQLIVTDQHVNARFGSTIAEVEREFRVAAAVDMGQQDGSAVGRARALGACTTGMADALDGLKPDILVLYGDRGEVLATAVTAVHLGIPMAHLQGGDVSGNVDEVMRHALTKLAHLHFPSTDSSAARIRGMGEEDWRIHVVGDNHIDLIVAGEYTPEAELRAKFEIPDGERPIIVLQHPETVRMRDAAADMDMILEAVLARGQRTIVVYPCSDHGFEGIVRSIEAVRDRPGVSVHRNIDAPDFWGLLAFAGAMVGNSSAGLIETPSFRLPAVNIGERQKGREHSDNVIHVDFDRPQLDRALDTALSADFRRRVAGCRQPFGDGTAWRRIVEVLKSVELGPALLEKRFVLRGN
jgi:UDP-N-acetylglucosamine 2-epimerase (non-hydrolysing)/GDP/UDP-N,N'-diacetylbacillosamine 2-epimerase (hydrolysing)